MKWIYATSISLLLLVGGWGLVGSFSIAGNAGAYPRFIAIVLLLLTGTLVVKGLKETDDDTVLHRQGFVRAMVLLGYTMLLILGMETIGFYLATPIFLLVSMWTLKLRDPKLLGLTTVVIMLIIHFGFKVFFSVPIPQGILFS